MPLECTVFDSLLLESFLESNIMAISHMCELKSKVFDLIGCYGCHSLI